MIWAWVTKRFEGYHKWSAAPEEVAFLRDKHRHIFHVKVYVEQLHDNRDVEFILLNRMLGTVIDGFDKENLGSCEMVAEEIMAEMRECYANRSLLVDVSEDGENGAAVDYDRQ